MSALYEWLDSRADLTRTFSPLLFRKIPKGVGWWYTFGSATLFTFVLQAVTGAFLAMYYSPSPDHAYDSVQYVTNEAIMGSFIRGLHHWGASAMVVLVVLHMLRVVIMAAYKYPRELTWLLGVGLLIVTMGFGFTGYLLPWDEKAYWATTVGTNMAGTIPLVGGWLLRLVRGGADLGAVTLTRFFSLHVLFLPALAGAIIAGHLFLVVKLGISAPPDREPDESPVMVVTGRRGF
ncbi:MAG TPA: cytochrome b N-terminal domain-containing protein [Chloroflexota bacterium]